MIILKTMVLGHHLETPTLENLTSDDPNSFKGIFRKMSISTNNLNIFTSINSERHCIAAYKAFSNYINNFITFSQEQIWIL